jgi:hypothetical protein
VGLANSTPCCLSNLDRKGSGLERLFRPGIEEKWGDYCTLTAKAHVRQTVVHSEDIELNGPLTRHLKCNDTF